MQTVQAIPHKHKDGGDRMNIVKTLKLGNATVHICDDHCAKTPEEKEKVLSDMQDACWKAVDAMVARGEKV